MFSILKNFLPRALQDVITSAAALLVAHGYLTASQEQGFIGSVFFLGMLVLNYAISHGRKMDAAGAGAIAAGGVISETTASNIAKGKTP